MNTEQTVMRHRAEQEQMERRHILAVNGNAAFLELLRALFQAEHYNVTTTNFVPRTFDLIETLRPDLVIVDLVVRHEAGWELLDKLHQSTHTRGIPLLLTSTTPSLLNQAQAEAARLGNHRTLVKPFDLDVLLATVRELIGPA